MNAQLRVRFDIEDYLEKKGVELYERNARNWCLLDECIFCGESKKAYVLVDKDNEKPNDFMVGWYNCYVCNKKTPFEAIVAKLEKVSFKRAKEICYGKGKINESIIFSVSEDEKCEKEEPEKSVYEIASALKHRELPFGSKALYEWPKEKYSTAQNYLHSRGVDNQTIQELNIHIIPYLTLREKLDILCEKFNITDATFKKKLPDLLLSKEEKVKKSVMGNQKLKNLKDKFDEMGLHSERIIFESTIGKKRIGYISRAYKKEFFGPKVLNSKGGLTSDALTHFNFVRDKELIVFTEGIFDAITCGHNQSIPLLGKSINSSQSRYKLLSLLKAKEVLLILDPGARDEINDMANLMLTKFEKVSVGFTPNQLSLKDPSREDQEILKILDVVTNEDDDYPKYYIAPVRLKVFKNICKLLKKGKCNSNALKNDYLVIQLLEKQFGKMSDVHKKETRFILGKFNSRQFAYAASHSELLSVDFMDANDLGSEFMKKVIESRVEFNPILDYSTFDQISKFPMDNA